MGLLVVWVIGCEWWIGYVVAALVALAAYLGRD